MVSALFTLPLPELSILVVDDNSQDGTGQIADKLALKHPGRMSVHHRPGKLGLGTAYLSGFKLAIEAGSEAVAQMDADFSHPPEKLVELANRLESPCDMVIGSRYVQGGQLDVNWPLWRKWLSAFGNGYARTILGLSIHDVTGGFRLWRCEVLKGLPLENVRSNGYVFQVEMAYLTHRLGYSMKEIPIYFAERTLGKSKMSLRIQVEAALRTWYLLWLYRDIKPRR
jgi:dolichol-phosphate mannosyltransferase